MSQSAFEIFKVALKVEFKKLHAFHKWVTWQLKVGMISKYKHFIICHSKANAYSMK